MILQTKPLMALALALIILLIAWLLIRRHRTATSPLNFDDLLIGDDGKISKAATVMFGSFAFTTWLMGYLAFSGKMDATYFAAYLAAWVAPAVTKLIVGRPLPTVAITETSTVSKSKTATPTV